MLRVSRGVLVVAVAIAGCKAPVTPTKASRTPAPAAGLANQPPVTVAGSGTLHSLAPTPAPSGMPAPPLAASLTGVVLAPPGIVSNNGGSLISDAGSGIVTDHGSGVVSNNGGSLQGRYRLQALAQSPMANARVYLLDAAGHPVRGGDGQAVTAMTDAQGRYAFSGALPSHDFLLAVELADGKGLWEAVLPKDGGARQTVNLDLISTLATTYILDQYVASQADPQATLDKLPASADADTRARAAAAFDGSGAAVPGSFQASATVPLVNTLRQKDAAFDTQLEVVRKLLIAAGQSDFGNGQAATSVRFGRLQSVLPQPDGSYWLCSQDDGRIWRLDAQGVLHALAGTGVAATGARAGQLATEAGFEFPSAIARDAHGRLVILDAHKVWRVDAAGKLELLWDEGTDVFFAAEWVVMDGDDALLVNHMGGLTRLTAAGAIVPVGDLPIGSADIEGLGRRPDGKLTMALDTFHLSDAGVESWTSAGLVIDPTTGATEPALDVPGKLLHAAPDGTWVSMDTDGSLVFTPPAGSAERFAPAQLAKLPAFGDFGMLARNQVDWSTDSDIRYTYAPGHADVYTMYELHEMTADGSVKHLAGLDPARITSGDSHSIALDAPSGVAAGADGNIYIADNSLKQILVKDAAGLITRFSGVGGWLTENLTMRNGVPMLAYGDAPEFDFGVNYHASAVDARYTYPSLLRVDAHGQVWVLDEGTFLRKLSANGDLASPYVVDFDKQWSIVDFLPMPDGTALVVREEGDTASLLRTAADGTTTRVATLPTAKGGASLAVDALGNVFVRAGDTLYALHGSTFQALFTDARIAVDQEDGNGPLLRLAVDATGRFYLTTGTVLLRWKPGDPSAEVLAGKGGQLLNGPTADSGVQTPWSPAFDAAGNLYLADMASKQIKRLAAGQL